MQKRYQVFISSTFADLEDERKTVMHAIQKAGYFVAGMELFASDDADSWEVIMRSIDQCDYYVLVIAGRYGSIAPDGKSFTEKEYLYAREKNIPVLAFIHSNREALPSGKVEKIHIAELDEFIKLVNSNHNRTTWTTKDDLATSVLATLTHSTYLRPGIGWVRGSVERENDTLRERLDGLQQRYERVREERDAIAEQLAASNPRDLDLAWSEDKFIFEVNESYKDSTNQRVAGHQCIETTWEKLFRVLAPRLIGWENTEKIQRTLLKEFAAASTKKGVTRTIKSADVVLIRSQLVAKGLIDVDREVNTYNAIGYNYESELWKLTSQGLFEMSAMLAHRRPSESKPQAS